MIRPFEAFEIGACVKGAAWVGADTDNYMSGRDGHKVDLVVIHVMGGTLPGTDAFFRQSKAARLVANQAAWDKAAIMARSSRRPTEAYASSAHYGIGTPWGSPASPLVVHQYVREADEAYHAGISDWSRVTAKLVKSRPNVNPNLYCCVSKTRILTRDMRWIPAGDLKVGDALIGFEDKSEAHHRRRLVTAWVTANSAKRLLVYRVCLKNGEELRCTGEHKWIVRKRAAGTGQRWMRTDVMANSMSSYKREGPLLMPKFFSPADVVSSYDAGFLSAAFDSEGNIGHNAGAYSFNLVFAQRENELLRAVQSRLTSEGFQWSCLPAGTEGGLTVKLIGGKHTALRFLMQYRPPRLLSRFCDVYDLSQQRLTPMEDIEVVRVIPDGTAEIAAISSSSKTYIAEGFAAHNTIGVEHEGTATSPWSDAMYAVSSRVVGDICQRYGIPVDRDHIVGHREVYPVKPCPGMCDLDKLVELVRKYDASTQIRPRGAKEVVDVS